MTLATEPFELDIRVTPDDIDAMGHVNNIVYLRWVQEAATAHWLAATTAEEQERWLWVVSRHEIEYKRPAFEQDQIVARTWIGGADRMRFERHTQLLRSSDRKVLAQARTLWVPIDPATGRPTQVSDDLRERFSVSDTD